MGQCCSSADSKQSSLSQPPNHQKLEQFPPSQKQNHTTTATNSHTSRQMSDKNNSNIIHQVELSPAEELFINNVVSSSLASSNCRARLEQLSVRVAQQLVTQQHAPFDSNLASRVVDAVSTYFHGAINQHQEELKTISELHQLLQLEKSGILDQLIFIPPLQNRNRNRNQNQNQESLSDSSILKRVSSTMMMRILPPDHQTPLEQSVIVAIQKCVDAGVVNELRTLIERHRDDIMEAAFAIGEPPNPQFRHFDEVSQMFWSDEDELYFCPARQLFFEPKHQIWHEHLEDASHQIIITGVMTNTSAVASTDDDKTATTNMTMTTMMNNTITRQPSEVGLTSDFVWYPDIKFWYSSEQELYYEDQRYFTYYSELYGWYDRESGQWEKAVES